MTTQNRPQNHGFSLVELSIVLVILGLLTGGILTGQSLIKASELRAVTSELQRFQSAAQTFRDKYFAVPGDFASVAAGFSAAPWPTAGGGNNDGQIVSTATANTNEPSLFWVQLSAAGMVEGTFTNVANTTFTAGTNNPRSKLSQAGWNIMWLGTRALADATYYEGDYGNAFFFGGGTALGTPTAILKPEDAWNIDTKMDDGRPAVGGVKSLESQGNATAGSGCGNLATAATTLAASLYDLTATGTTCSLVIKSGF